MNDYFARFRSIIFKVPKELNYGISLTPLIAEILKGENSQQFCAGHFLVGKHPSSNKPHKNSVNPEAVAECQGRIFVY